MALKEIGLSNGYQLRRLGRIPAEVIVRAFPDSDPREW